ncbi:sigma-E processing peptidase SpoIIGA [Clostridium sp. MSJ-4]|uniref:Sporulation sigma-E factor-processing peptidase n=1 Tax=Clostridium simiarum TaxID=2841506 RepID=A0ABS6EXR2_9CLOT|nr:MULTISPECIES: sigma-E processing peptidase SpoIIGA [Clostridium]MBU5590920.1 sigma-E processing peptidase SpoIIGA [Clostridium simiarum]
MVVYLDVLIIENFIVNLFLIFITSDTLRVKVKVVNAIIAAVVATSYLFVMFVPKLSAFNSIYIKIPLVIVFMVVSFARLDLAFILKASIVYIIYSMILSGLCFFIGINNINFIDSKNPLDSFSYKYILMAIMILYIILNRTIGFIRDRAIVDNLIYSIEVVHEGKIKGFKGFLDTGNELREPVTNLPVIIVYKEALGNISISEKDKYRIPYKVVNGYKGNLEGFKPESVRLFYNKNQKISIKPIEAIICLCDNPLSEGGEYAALLSRGIL